MATHEDVIRIILFESFAKRKIWNEDTEWKGNKEGGNFFIYFFIYLHWWNIIYSNVVPPISISIEITVGISYFENWTTVVGTIDWTILARKAIEIVGKTALFCSKSTMDRIVRTVKWWIAVGIKSWRELVLTERWIRTSGQKPTRVGEIRFPCHVVSLW